jgi:putative tricarboxylic transport membrane protein
MLEKRGWLDAYMPQAEFEAFLKEERGRVEATLRAVGLVK